MPIKMIVTDLDRTLLRDDKTISPYTAETLAELARRGIPFVTATARPIRTVREQLSFLRFDAAVYHNGAVIMAGDRTIAKYGIPEPGRIAAAMLRDRPERKISIESNDRMYSNMAAEELWPGVRYVKTADFRETAGLIADKILISVGSLEEMSGLEGYVPGEAYLQLSENSVAMMMNRRATKLNGIKLLAERYGVGLGEVAAFGDDYNDIEMLRECGAGVAVANALPEVKAAADEICGSNEEDGAARWIREKVLT